MTDTCEPDERTKELLETNRFLSDVRSFLATQNTDEARALLERSDEIFTWWLGKTMDKLGDESADQEIPA